MGAGWAEWRLRGFSQSRGRSRGLALEGLEQQVDGGPVCPLPRCAGQRGTDPHLSAGSRLGQARLQVGAPFWSKAFSILLGESSIDGVISVRTAVPSASGLLGTPPFRTQIPARVSWEGGITDLCPLHPTGLFSPRQL